jgi:polysaccharide pyruvyl transferase WcaK-like protein
MAREMLETFENAELVVTSRIHSLMPSMSKGTPAILVHKDMNDPRFIGLKKF